MKYYNPKTKEVAEIVMSDPKTDVVVYKVVGSDKEVTEKYEDFIKKFYSAIKES